MITVTIPLEEYEELQKQNSSCTIDINNYMIPLLETEIMKFRLMIKIMKDEKSFKHDRIRVPRIGEFSLSELKKEIQELK